MFQGAAMTAALAAGGTLLAVMICISWYGAVSLPSAARVPVHWGFGWGSYVSKRSGLIIWPAAGALIFGLVDGFAGPAWSQVHRASWAGAAFTIAIMGMLAAFQAGALAAARRTVTGSGPDPAPR